MFKDFLCAHDHNFDPVIYRENDRITQGIRLTFYR